MSKINSRQLLGGETPTPPQNKSRASARGFSQKRQKKPMKSNITNKVKSTHASAITPADSQSDDEEGDSSAIEEQKSTGEEPDAFALSDAQQQVFNGAAVRLTGHELEEHDMFKDVSMTDEEQAVAGAQQSRNGIDDNDYADVEYVSDSDESQDGADERSILRSAERDLIGEFERTEQRRNASTVTFDMNGMALHEDEALARRLSLHGSDSQNDEFGFPINLDIDPFEGLAKDDNKYEDMCYEAESALWRMPETVRSREGSDPAATLQKRVRFEDVFSTGSSRSNSEDANDAFPDLFTALDDPGVMQSIALGMEQDSSLHHADFGDAESFFDFEDEDEKLAFEVDEESDSDDDRSSYDSDDEGDTTDEETREEQLAKMEERKRAVGTPPGASGTPLPTKRAIQATARSPSTPRPATPKNCKGPKSGTFAIDPTRASMTTDAEGKKIKLLPPTHPLEKDKAFWERARTANNSRDGSPRNSYITMPSPGSDNIPSRPFTAQSTLGSMFNGNLDILRNNDISGIADDMFPAMMMHSQTSFTTTTTTDSDTERQDINMQDFIDMNDSDSDSERPPTRDVTSPIDPDMFSSFTSDGAPGGRRGSDLLGHFDQCRGTVGSFRRNQHHAKHISSLASHPSKRASAHEFNALQKGRRGAANTPMTPARKKRASQDLTQSGAGIRKSVNSPLTARRPRSRGNSLAGISSSDLYQTLTRSQFE